MRPLTCLSGEGAGLPTLASILPLPHSPSHLHQRGLLITRPNQTSSRRFREVVFNGGLRRRRWSIQTLGADTGSPRSVPPFCTFGLLMFFVSFRHDLFALRILKLFTNNKSFIVDDDHILYIYMHCFIMDIALALIVINHEKHRGLKP